MVKKLSFVFHFDRRLLLYHCDSCIHKSNSYTWVSDVSLSHWQTLYIESVGSTEPEVDLIVASVTGFMPKWSECWWWWYHYPGSWFTALIPTVCITHWTFIYQPVLWNIIHIFRVVSPTRSRNWLLVRLTLLKLSWVNIYFSCSALWFELSTLRIEEYLLRLAGNGEICDGRQKNKGIECPARDLYGDHYCISCLFCSKNVQACKSESDRSILL